MGSRLGLILTLALTLTQNPTRPTRAQVDEGFCTWKQPTVILFGTGDPWIKSNTAFEFLESKRTNMKVITQTAKVGGGRVRDGGRPHNLPCLS